MAVLRLIPVSGSDFNIDHTGKRAYKRSWIVDTDSPSYQENVLIQECVALGLPSLFSTVHVTDPGAIVAGYTVTQFADGPEIYQIDVTYASHLYEANNEPEDNTRPPQERRSKVSYEGTSVQIAVTKDVQGKPLVNSANEPYKGYTIEVPCLIIRIDQYEMVPRVPLYIQYFNAMNSVEWQGFPAKTLRVNDCRASPTFLEGYQNVYMESWCMLFNPLGWERFILDQGTREKDVVSVGHPSIPDGTQLYKQIYDGPHRVTSPVPLDGSGVRLLDGAEMVYNKFVFNKPLPFNTLGIPR